MALNRSCSCNPKPLGAGKKYHYSVLYNHYEGPSSRRQGDHLISWNFLKDLNGKLAEKGYDQVMYHDIAVAGSNIFNILFSMVNESEKIVVLLTPEFLQNGWHKYSGQAAVKNLLDKHETQKFVPIAINIGKEGIPEDIGLSVSTFIFTDYKNDKVDEDIWEADEGVWDRVHEAVGHTEVHYEQNRHLHSESCDLTGRAVPVEIRIPHDRVERLQSVETDSPHPDADDSADGDGYRGASRGNARASNENPPEQSANRNYVSQPDETPPPAADAAYGDGRRGAGHGTSNDNLPELSANRNYANQLVETPDDGYTSEDNRSMHSPTSNIMASISVKPEPVPEQSKRLERDGACSKPKTEGISSLSKPISVGSSNSPTSDRPRQPWYHRALSWSLEKIVHDVFF